MTKSKGIHDPWRMGTPEWEPPAEDAPAGTKRSALAFDWDLQPEKTYVLRHSGSSIKFIGADEPVGAITLLIYAFLKEDSVRKALTDAGFEHREDGGGSGFTLRVKEHVLACPVAVDARDGMHRLCNALRQLIRTNRQMKARLTRLGIVPLVG